jgi:hypothetical protein
MVTLNRLNRDYTNELHRRLGRKWRAASTLELARRQYRLMCRVFIREHNLLHAEMAAKFQAWAA